jgi:hypothetical protein
LTLPKLATAIVLIALFASAVRVPTSPDMWWHLRCGEVQWRTQNVLKEDIFSHTATGTPWVNQSWLPQLAMYALYVLGSLAAPGGFAALALAVAALVAATFGIVWLASLSVERATPIKWQVATWWMPYWRAFVILWAAIASGPVWVARPHLLTLFFTALWIWLLERWRRGSGVSNWRALAWLPPLMLVWANCHSAYIIGLLLLGLEVASALLDACVRERHGRESRDALRLWPGIRLLLLIALLCTLAALLNPQGIHLLLMPFRTLGSAAQQTFVAEWASPDFHTRETWPFLGLLLATWTALALSDQRPRFIDLLRALVFTALALRSMRYMGLSAVVLAPLLVHYGARVLRRVESRWSSPGVRTRPTRGSPVLNWALLTLVLVGAGLKMALPLNAATIARVHEQIFPVAAVDHIRAESGSSPGEPSPAILPETLFNNYGWGGYLIWRLYPDTLVFIDGRADPYGDELIGAYQRAVSAQPGWEETLEQYAVHSALIPADCALASVLGERGDWQAVYEDRLAALFVKRPEGY